MTHANPSRFVPAVGDPVSTLWHRLCRGTRVLRRRSDWQRAAGDGWEDRIMAEAVSDRFHAKQWRSIGRWTAAAGGRPLTVYLKRHYRLPWHHGLLATLFPGRAWAPGLQEWQHLTWAAAAGLPVPRAVAAGQLVGPWLRLQSFLAVEELAGMLPLHEAVPLAHATLPPAAFTAWKRGLCREMARIAREMHRRRVFHKDLYFCHYYIPESLTAVVPAEWTGRVHIIDLHRLARHRLTAVWWRVKDLGQLLYSSEVAGVTARDRVRFWKLYGGGFGRPPGRWLLALVRLKWRLYRRHNRRRKLTVPRAG